MGAFGVVVLEVLGDDAVQVPVVGDQDPVEALLADRLHHALCVGVRDGRADRREDDADTVGLEHGVEGGRELGVAVADQDPDALEDVVDGQVPGLLGDPAAVRVGGGAGEVDAAAGVFDEEQDGEAAQDRVDGEEVAGADVVGLVGEELAPGRAVTSRRWSLPGLAEDAADGCGGDAVADLSELAADPVVASAWVLAGEAEDQVVGGVVDRWPAAAGVGLAPAAVGEGVVPAEDPAFRR